MNQNVLLASPPVLAALAALLAFAVAAFALGIARARREEVRAALQVLGAMRWREFAHHVAGVLARRGLRQDDLDHLPGEEGFDLRMTRGAARYLVQCKQLGARPLGEPAVREFATAVRQQGAEGGILVTTGGLDSGARRAASQSGVELLSGYQLWRQLRPLLPLDLVREIQDSARARRTRKALLALVLAAVAGIGVFLTAATLRPGTSVPADSAAAPATAAPQAQPRPTGQPSTAIAPPPAAADDAAAAAAGTPAATAAAPAELPQQMPDPTLTEAQLAARRAEAERAVRGLPGVLQASWGARSTLVLTLPAAADGALPEATIAAACAALVRFEELRYTRLQLQPEASTAEAQAWVRWRQCR